MKKFVIYFISLLAIAVVIFSIVFFKPKNNQPIIEPICENKKHQISLTLQSGEKGVISITDNKCDLNLSRQTDNLSFKVLADGAIEDSIYQSKLYIWSRNNNLSIEEQIKNLAKNKACQLEKNNYLQRDGLITYAFNIVSTTQVDCMLFGSDSDFASEIFMENNNLLILQRQDGSDGIEPFNLAAIKFTEE